MRKTISVMAGQAGTDRWIMTGGIFLVGGAIIVDAFIIRTVLVPALMHLTGNANWWLPRRLDRLIPHLNVEGAHHPVPVPVRPRTAGATVPGSRD